MAEEASGEAPEIPPRTSEEASETPPRTSEQASEIPPRALKEASEIPPRASEEEVAEQLSAANALKELGNDALKAKDLPLAIEKYEEALNVWQKAIVAVPQNSALSQNDAVLYAEEGFGIVETCDVIFQEFHIQDSCNGQMVKHKVGKYEDVVTKFKREELAVVPRELFDLRLAILQNLSLVALKLARASRRKEDFEEVVRRANEALFMNGTAAKASMRKGEALYELKDMEGAMRALAVAQQETKGRDEEVTRLLQQVLAAKGKGKGKGKGGKGGKGPNSLNLKQQYNKCHEPGCDLDHPHSHDDADGSAGSSSDEEPIIEEITESLEPSMEKVTSGPDDTEDGGLADEEVFKTLKTRPTPCPDSSSRAVPRNSGWCSQRSLLISASILVVIIGNAVLMRGGSASVELSI